MKRFIDIGANLTDPQFRGVYRGTTKHSSDFGAMLNRAREQHVVAMLVTGSSIKESEEALDLCRNNSNFLFSTVGIHPCSSKTVPEGMEEVCISKLQSLAMAGIKEGHVKAFGEIGLDYDRLHFAPAETQQRVFKIQLELAKELKLPLFLHSRAANDDFVQILKPYAYLGGVVHSFTGSLRELNDLLDLGLYIGVNGCSLKTKENLEVVKEIPIDKIMLETDGPWCEIRKSHASHQYIKKMPYEFAKKPEKWQPGHMVRGRCEPCSIVNVAQVVAMIKGISEDELASAAYDNTCRVFFSSHTAQNPQFH